MGFVRLTNQTTAVFSNRLEKIFFRGDVFKKMVPEQFKDMPEGDLVDKLRAQMDGLSRKRINHVLQVCKHAPSCG